MIRQASCSAVERNLSVIAVLTQRQDFIQLALCLGRAILSYYIFCMKLAELPSLTRAYDYRSALDLCMKWKGQLESAPQLATLAY